LVIPFDTVHFGEHVKKYFGKYNAGSLFHQSSLPTLVQQNVNNMILDRKQNVDMKELLRVCLYQGSPVNVLLP